jgi:allophanate hydrolase
MKLISQIVAEHRAGASPVETIRAAYARLREWNDPALLIATRPESEAVALAEALAARPDAAQLPLYGVPFLVKDNIDVAGLPTSAACPASAYSPAQSSFVVKRLEDAGAIVIGKTNLDQFATGLVGVRSPHGVPRNSVDPALVPGGSSSGSATAVGAGIVPFSLGTDTAGSGRIPAALNRIVGLKPSLGALSATGVVPACCSLDTISIFALTVDEADLVYRLAAGFDEADSYSKRIALSPLGPVSANLRVGVPRPQDLIFLGDALAQAAFDASLAVLKAMGAQLVEIDISAFLQVAKLLYEGPWVAERAAATKEILANNPDAMLPVTREIISGGLQPGAVAAFEAFYKLADLRRATESTWSRIDMLAVPTMPTVYTVAEVLADPIRLNSNFGTYTNFVNLLDLAALAVPGPDRADARPAGLTFIAPSGSDAKLASVGRVFQAKAGARLGATGAPCPALAELATKAPAGWIELAVVGAHLSGMALNHELTSRDAIFLRKVETTKDYRFYALPGGPPERPGLVRVMDGEGASIAAEVWALRPDAFGTFVAGIPSPLGVGNVRFTDGSTPKGFLCEAEAVKAATNISHLGGWRAYVASKAKAG